MSRRTGDLGTLVFTDGSTPASNPDFFPFDAAVAAVPADGGPVLLLAGPCSGRVESTSLR